MKLSILFNLLLTLLNIHFLKFSVVGTNFLEFPIGSVFLLLWRCDLYRFHFPARTYSSFGLFVCGICDRWLGDRPPTHLEYSKAKC